MGFFSKRKSENNGFVITDEDNIKISGDKHLAPHAMTAGEVSALNTTDDNPDEAYDSSRPSALDSLKKRMLSHAEPESQPEFHTPEVCEPTDKQNQHDSAFTQEATTQSPPQSDNAVKQESKEVKTLLEKLKRYTVDEQGRDLAKSQEPLYRLQSVAEILKSNGEKSLEELSKKYDISFDDLGKERRDVHTASSKPKQNPVSNSPEPTDVKTATPAFEQMVNDAEKREEQQLYESLFPSQSKKESIPFDISVPDISDIDNFQATTNTENNISNTATIRFTPVKDNRGNTDHISISSITKHIDLSDELEQSHTTTTTSATLEQSEFEMFLPRDEMTDSISGKKLIRRIALKKRSSFLATLVSALSVIATSVFLMPPVYDFIISNPKASMIVCGAFLLISVLANIDMFADFKNLTTKRCSFDILSSLCSILTLSLTVCAVLTFSNAYYSILLCTVILFARAFGKFKETSAMLGNLKQIAGDKTKKAVTLISDTATTFAMAKNTIEGDVLVAAHRKTDFVEDFMKHSKFSAKFSGKTSALFFLTLGFSVICGLMGYFYYQSAFEAFYCASTVSCLMAMPSLFFVDALPLASAAKRLNTKGAMIAGMYGAEKIEMANAAVISINDIFPQGTVTMYSMKVLSDNNIDETILRAASLTAAVNSPLEAIFKQIAGTNSSYSIPDSDTVKYEKRLGISGWVDNELLFIGNRSLMEAHGIEIPSVEVDKKILRKGYFPVYVASENTACALIVIQYDVRRDIAKDLRKLTELGLMLLVDNCDPNINEEMLCDYFGLYEDSVKIMTNAGVHMYKNATNNVPKCSAPAAFRGSDLTFIKIIRCASLIKKSNKLLTIMYALFAIFGITYFVYAAFSGLSAMPEPFTMLLYNLTATILSIIGFLIRKP